MKLAKDVTIAWPSTNGSIPAGFVRDTDFDDRYPKGTANLVNPNVTGGTTTHAHTAVSNHSHSENDHNHTFTISGDSQSVGAGSADHAAQAGHSHSGTSGSLTGGGLTSVAANYGSCSNDPPYYTVIWIKSLGTHGIPNLAIVYFDSASVPTGWFNCDGNNSTPNLANKYLKGATTGGDGGTTGGSTTNVHELEHTHTVNSHSHGNAGTTTAGDAVDDTSGSDINRGDHGHIVSFASTTPTISATYPSLNTAETVEPAYKKLLAIQNRSGSNQTPFGLIGLWKNALSAIPRGFVLCDGTLGTQDMRDRFVKCAADSSEIGNTGGANTHSHASQSHGHTASATHNHTISGGLGHVGGTDEDGSGASASHRNSVHTSQNVQQITATYANSSTSANSSDNQPPFRTVAFIKLLYASQSFAQILS